MANILIALDSPDHLLDTLRTRLATAGHLAVTTCDGAEAWGLAATGLFDCAVLDTSVHTGDGVLLLDRIRQTPHTSDLPVALVARDAQEQIRLLGRPEDHVRVVLAQPVSASDVLEAAHLHFGVTVPPATGRMHTPTRPAPRDAPAQSTHP